MRVFILDNPQTGRLLIVPMNDLYQHAELQRTVAAHLEVYVSEQSDLVLAIAASVGHDRRHEQLLVSLDGAPVDVRWDGPLCFLEGLNPGLLLVDYSATVFGLLTQATATAHDVFEYIRPSRYCESDQMGPLARSQFDGLEGADLLAGISSWVGVNIDYVPGSSRPIDGAIATLLGREGVCRDFAHLTTALLRANNIPARVVSVYAPGLNPMDFHAVTEACLDGAWYVVDPTCLAPRQSMVRIATGADATDIAFLTTLRGAIDLNYMGVSAMTNSGLVDDDITQLAYLQ